jgi:hypothetical protein
MDPTFLFNFLVRHRSDEITEPTILFRINSSRDMAKLVRHAKEESGWYHDLADETWGGRWRTAYQTEESRLSTRVRSKTSLQAE